MEEKFNYVKSGYDPDQVNEYIDTLETVIKGYKEKESLIIKAIVSAQSVADDIIKKAEIKAGKAEKEALQRRDAILAAIEKEKDSVRLFHEEYNALLQKHLHPVDDSEISGIISKMDDLRDYLAGIK